MKPIKIYDSVHGTDFPAFEKNETMLEEILKEKNGMADTHTFVWGSQISDGAEAMEQRFDDAEIPKKYRPGAKARLDSAEVLPNAYKWPVKTNWVNLERRATGWFVNSILCEETMPAHSPGYACDVLELTPKQKEIVTSKALHRVMYDY